MFQINSTLFTIQLSGRVSPTIRPDSRMPENRPDSRVTGYQSDIRCDPTHNQPLSSQMFNMSETFWSVLIRSIPHVFTHKHSVLGVFIFVSVKPAHYVLSGKKLRYLIFCNFPQARRTIIFKLFGSQEGGPRF